MRFWQSIAWLGAAGFLATGSIACIDDSASAEGQEGNLEFVYDALDSDSTFDRPLAVGSSLPMYVEPADDRSFDRLSSVFGDPEDVLTASLDSGSNDSFVITGHAAGDADIVAEAVGGGETYTDFIGFQVDEVDQVELSHRCTTGTEAGYLVDESMHLDFYRFNQTGTKLIGEAPANADSDRACQIEMTPTYLYDQAVCNEAGLHIDPVSELGEFVVTADSRAQVINQSHRELGLHVIHPDELDFQPVGDDLRAGSTRDVDLAPDTESVRGEFWPVCTSLNLEIDILTPDVCESSTGRTRFDVDASDHNEFRLHGNNSGWCEFQINLADYPGVDGWIRGVEIR